MHRLKSELSVLAPLLDGDGSIALVGEPVHRNIGDHLIQLGTERFLRDYNFRTLARAHRYNYSARSLRRQIGDRTVILLSGGGHLGDLYPWHQRLRERVLADFPRHRIVVLPQSVYFRDEAPARAAAASFHRHPDCHLVLRERDSLERAAGLSAQPLVLAPDMSHALYPLSAEAEGKGELFILRQDAEALQVAADFRVDKTVDWPDLVGGWDIARLVAAMVLGTAGRLAASPDAGLGVLDSLRYSLVSRAQALYAPVSKVYSTRLHGALLALLLDRQACLLPSLTGKSQAYFRTWLGDHPNAALLD